MAEFEKLQQNTGDFYDPATAWRTKEPASHKEICIRALEQCRVAWSQDMKEGGTYNVQTPKGIMPVYFPDQRVVCMSATDTFYDLMVWYFDDKAEKNIGKIKEKIDNSSTFHAEKIKELRGKTGPVYHKQMDERADRLLIDYLLKLYREMFRELILLFKRKNELSAKRKLEAY